MELIMDVRIGKDKYGTFRAIEKETQAGGSGPTILVAFSELVEELEGRAFWAGQSSEAQKEEKSEGDK